MFSRPYFPFKRNKKRIKITSDLSIRNKLSLHAIVPYLSSICDFANLCFSGCQFCVIVVSGSISIIASEASHSLTTAVFSFKRVPFRKCILFSLQSWSDFNFIQLKLEIIYVVGFSYVFLSCAYYTLEIHFVLFFNNIWILVEKDIFKNRYFFIKMWLMCNFSKKVVHVSELRVQNFSSGCSLQTAFFAYV